MITLPAHVSWTARTLIAALQTLPPDTILNIDGCGCCANLDVGGISEPRTFGMASWVTVRQYAEVTE